MEKKISSEAVYRGKIIDVNKDTVVLENGKQTLREVVVHHGGACVLAIDNGVAYFVRQYRYPFQAALLELPAGKLEKCEDPAVAARRELIEECGLEADKLEFLGVMYPTVAYCTEKIYMYLATSFKTVAQKLDEDEFLDVEKIPFDAAVQMVLKGEIPDAKTQIAILKANELLKK